MNNIKYLEFQRLMKELQFVESDYTYQSEVIKLADTEFLKSVENILDDFPALKDLYKQKKEIISQSISNNIPISEDLSSSSSPINYTNDNPDLKRLYRDIVKTTHPDKIQNHKLNELYLEATEAYENNDMVTLYKVCSELSISFDLPENFIEDVKIKIDDYKERVKFLEKTYTFQWLKSNSIDDKNKILVSFIRSGVI